MFQFSKQDQSEREEGRHGTEKRREGKRKEERVSKLTDQDQLANSAARRYLEIPNCGIVSFICLFKYLEALVYFYSAWFTVLKILIHLAPSFGTFLKFLIHCSVLVLGRYIFGLFMVYVDHLTIWQYWR